MYRARLQGRTGFEKEVAIKILHAGAPGQEEFAARMRDEARVLALLRHRAIVGVEDLLQIGERTAIVMELIEGADLAAFLKLGPAPPRASVEIARDVAWALAAVHSAVDPATGEPMQLVHRDVKPANIRITPSGDVKVMDFGVARARFVDRESRTESLSFGSWGYMAPERFDDHESAASDIYALGAVLFESIAGVRLKQLSVNPDKHRRALVGALQGAEVDSPPLLALIERMMSYEPEARPGAAEAASELRALAPSLPGAWLNDWAAATLPRLAREAPDAVLLPVTSSSPSPRGAPAPGAPALPSPLDAPDAAQVARPASPHPLMAPPGLDDADSGPISTGPVETVSLPLTQAAAPPPVAPVEPAQEAPEAAPEEEATAPSTFGLRSGVALGVLLVLALGVGAVLALRPDPAPEAPATSASAAQDPSTGPAQTTTSASERTPASSDGPPPTPESAISSARTSPSPSGSAATRPGGVSARGAETAPSAARSSEPQPPESSPATSSVAPPAQEATLVATPESAPTATEPAPADPEAAPSTAVRELSGSWQGEAFDRPMTLRLSFHADGSVTGTARSRLGAEEVSRPVSGSFRAGGAGEGELTLTESEGPRPITYQGSLRQGTISGDILVGGRSRGTWSARLQAP